MFNYVTYKEVKFKEFEPRLKFEMQLNLRLVPLKIVFNVSRLKPAFK